MYRIPLRVANVDLDADATLDGLASLDDLTWTEVDGRVIAIAFIECERPVGEVVNLARRIEAAIPGAVVVEVDQDLVNIPDIASRVGVNREAVRLWVEGKRGPGNFPPHVGSPGNSRVWQWARVQEWLRDNYGLGGDEKALTARETAEANAALAKVMQTLDWEWQTVSQFERVFAPAQARTEIVESALSQVLTLLEQHHLTAGWNWHPTVHLTSFERVASILNSSWAARIELHSE